MQYKTKIVGNIKIHILYVGLLENYVFVLEYKRGYAIVVDPGENIILNKFLNNKNIVVSDVLLTHNDWDHVDGVDNLKKIYNCNVYFNENDKCLTKIGTKPFKPGDTIDIQNILFDTKLVEGHVNHMVCYYNLENNFLLPGDALFKLGCGRMFHGCEKKYFKTMQYLLSFNEECLVFFPHEYTLTNFEFTKQIVKDERLKFEIIELEKIDKKLIVNRGITTPTTIGFEKKYNQFLNVKSAKEFKKMRDFRNNF